MRLNQSIIRIFNVELSRCVAELRGHKADVAAMRFGHDDRQPTLLSGDDNGMVRVWRFGDVFLENPVIVVFSCARV